MVQATTLDETGTAGLMAVATTAGMLGSDEALSVFDSESGDWTQKSWRDVHERAVEIAAQLIVDRGSREPRAVGLIGDPTHDLIAAVQGAWLAGVAVSILPGPIRGADEKRWAASTYSRFADIGIGTVLGGGTQLDLLAEVEGPLHVARVDEYGIGVDTAGFTPVVVSAEAPAVLQGTAGSTGSPKTAVLSHRAAYINTSELALRLDLGRTRDIGVSWLPLYHDMGLTFLVASMVRGLQAWIAPNTAFAASPFRWLQWLSDTRATLTAAPNFAYDILGRYGKLIKDVDLSSIRVSISGGEPIDPDAFDTFLAEAGRFGFDPTAAAPAYGMAESVCAVTMPSFDEPARYDEVLVHQPGAADAEPIRRRYAVLGKPLDGMQIRIVHADGEVPHIEGREVGHVEIRGTSMMQGYLGHAPLEPEEWFPTGDIGYLVEGRLVICGRAKEIVIVAGRNLFPVEIERAAATVPGVKRGSVVALARGEGSARPGLVVVAGFRGEDKAAARAAVNAEVAASCGIMPADVIFVDSAAIPRTTSGKLRRLEVKALVESGEWK